MAFDFLGIRASVYDIDFYKGDHKRQYPDDLAYVYSNTIARKSRVPGCDKVVVYGMRVLDAVLQTLVESLKQMGTADVSDYREFMATRLNLPKFDAAHIMELVNYVQKHDRLPVQIWTLPEGMIVPIQTPVLAIRNVEPEAPLGRSPFAWFVNYLETMISNTIWHPMTTATIANQYRILLDSAAERSGADMGFVNWQGHDFSFRGQTCLPAGRISGLGHLLSFYGTDTAPSIKLAEQLYPATRGPIVAGSIPATEHSVMCCGGPEGEDALYARLLTEVYPTGPVAIVGDSYDYWNCLWERLPHLKHVIMERDGKMVTRPDSGDPVKVILGDPVSTVVAEQLGVVRCLDRVCGHDINWKGFKALNPHIGSIYGDSITLDRADAIVEGLIDLGYVSTSTVLGIGSYTYQYVTRDTFGFAIKATAIKRGDDKTWTSIYKQPKTDPGKNSRKGVLAVTNQNGQIVTEENCHDIGVTHSGRSCMLQPLEMTRQADFNVMRDWLATQRNFDRQVGTC